MSDNGRAPTPRTPHIPYLSQNCWWYTKLERMLYASDNRLRAAREGKTLNVSIEQELSFRRQMRLDPWLDSDGNVIEPSMLDVVREGLVYHGKNAGAIWHWMCSIKGLGSGYVGARFLGEWDYPGGPRISNAWSYMGLDGERRRKKYNREAKAALLGDLKVVDQFIIQRTQPYREVYDEYKAYLESMYSPTCNVCEGPGRKVTKKDEDGNQWICAGGCKRPETGYWIRWTPSHLNSMARRKPGKLFVQHAWVLWRIQLGLPVSEPYAHRNGEHKSIIPPPNVDVFLEHWGGSLTAKQEWLLGLRKEAPVG